MAPKIEEEVKAMLSEIKKKIYRESPLKEVRIQIKVMVHKGEMNIQPEQKEETRIQIKEDSIRFWDISKCSSIES